MPDDEGVIKSIEAAIVRIADGMSPDRMSAAGLQAAGSAIRDLAEAGAWLSSPAQPH